MRRIIRVDGREVEVDDHGDPIIVRPLFKQTFTISPEPNEAITLEVTVLGPDQSHADFPGLGEAAWIGASINEMKIFIRSIG